MFKKRMLTSLSLLLNIILLIAVIVIINNQKGNSKPIGTSDLIQNTDSSQSADSTQYDNSSQSDNSTRSDNSTLDESNPVQNTIGSTLDYNKEDNLKLQYSDVMNNPIDQAYFHLITIKHIPQIEYREYQRRYEEIWSEEYNKVIQLLYKKAIYKKDRDNIDKFNTSISNFLDDNKTLFETCVLRDFNTDPAKPEKNSYGNGTTDKLNEIKGKIYRNACLLIIPLLEDGEYQYPDTIDFDKVIQNKD